MKSKRRSFLIVLAQIVAYFLLYFLLKRLLNQAIISLSISSLVFAVVVRKNRTLKLLATLILVASVIYLELKPNLKSRREQQQQQQQRYDDSNIRSLSSLTNSSSYSFAVFFLESDPRRKLPTTKETCAIESAAKNNPNALVMHYRAIVSEDQLARLVTKAYANVRLAKFEPEKVFTDTPILEWWKTISKSSTDSTYSQINEAFKYLSSLV